MCLFCIIRGTSASNIIYPPFWEAGEISSKMGLTIKETMGRIAAGWKGRPGRSRESESFRVFCASDKSSESTVCSAVCNNASRHSALFFALKTMTRSATFSCTSASWSRLHADKTRKPIQPKVRDRNLGSAKVWVIKLKIALQPNLMGGANVCDFWWKLC